MVIRWRSDPSPACGPKHPSIPVPDCPFGGRRPGGAWPPPSPLAEGGLISHLLPGEKVLRYEADEGFFGSTPRLSTCAPKCLPSAELFRLPELLCGLHPFTTSSIYYYQFTNRRVGPTTPSSVLPDLPFHDEPTVNSQGELKRAVTSDKWRVTSPSTRACSFPPCATRSRRRGRPRACPPRSAWPTRGRPRGAPLLPGSAAMHLVSVEPQGGDLTQPRPTAWVNGLFPAPSPERAIYGTHRSVPPITMKMPIGR